MDTFLSYIRQGAKLLPFSGCCFPIDSHHEEMALPIYYSVVNTDENVKSIENRTASTWSSSSEKIQQQHENRLIELKNSALFQEMLNNATDISEEDEWTCPITLDRIQEPTQTPCNHLFELSALRSSLELKKVCPTCNQDLSNFQANIHRETLDLMQASHEHTFTTEATTPLLSDEPASPVRQRRNPLNN